VSYVVIVLLFFGPSVLAAMLLARAWWTRSEARLSALDGPARLLALAVGAVPGERGEWAAAMESELAGVDDRAERWSFALSAARAAVCPPRSSRLPVVVAAGAALVLVVATSLAVGWAFPELQVLAVAFTAFVSAAAVVTVARRSRIAPSPIIIAGVVVAAVAGCIAATAYMLVKDPALTPVPAVLLAAVLAGFLWLALTPPRALMTSRPARGIGAAIGLALGAGFLWSTGFPSDTGNGVLDFVIFGSILTLFLGSGLAAFVDGSFRSGVQATVWGATIGMLLIFGIWLVEGVRWYEGGAGFLLDNDGPATIAANLTDALFWDFVFVSVWCVPFGIFGAAFGGWMRKTTARPARSTRVVRLARR
jgi:hypothetical protein